MIFMLNFKNDISFSKVDECDFEKRCARYNVSVHADNIRHVIYIHVDNEEYDKSLFVKDTLNGILCKEFRQAITEFENNGYISYSEVIEDSDSDKLSLDPPLL